MNNIGTIKNPIVRAGVVTNQIDQAKPTLASEQEIVGQRVIAIMVLCVHSGPDPDLPEISCTLRSFGALSQLPQRGQYQGRQNRKDRDDDEKLNQGKTRWSFAL